MLRSSFPLLALQLLLIALLKNRDVVAIALGIDEWVWLSLGLPLFHFAGEIEKASVRTKEYAAQISNPRNERRYFSCGEIICSFMTSVS